MTRPFTPHRICLSLHLSLFLNDSHSCIILFCNLTHCGSDRVAGGRRSSSPRPSPPATTNRFEAHIGERGDGWERDARECVCEQQQGRVSRVPRAEVKPYSRVCVRSCVDAHPQSLDRRRHDILPFISDKYLSIAAPVIAYWLVSLVFELAHRARSPFFEAYRIHEPAEVKSRNKVTRREVFWTVIAQQLVQTLMGILWIEDDPPELGPFRDHAADLDAYERVTRRLAIAALGRGIGSSLAREHGRKLAEWAYWWAVPAVRFALGA